MIELDTVSYAGARERIGQDQVRRTAREVPSTKRIFVFHGTFPGNEQTEAPPLRFLLQRKKGIKGLFFGVIIPDKPN